jgi:methylated-DNA-protein-cysteine methyltransferase related protein
VKPRSGDREEDLRRAVLRVVRRIPRGRVATYGEVAELAGRPGAARAVGRVLATLDRRLAREIPWQRVVNASGGISRRPGDGPDLQRQFLEAEGVRFRGRSRVDLERHRWRRAAAVSTARLGRFGE